MRKSFEEVTHQLVGKPEDEILSMLYQWVKSDVIGLTVFKKSIKFFFANWTI